MGWADYVAAAKRSYEKNGPAHNTFDGPVLWEAGWYAGKVLEVEDKVSRAGTEMLSVKFGLVNPAEERKELVQNFVYGARSETAARLARSRLVELGIAVGSDKEETWPGHRVMVRLKLPRELTRTDAEGRKWRNDNEAAGFRSFDRKERARQDTHGDEAMAQVLEKEPETTPEDDDQIPF